MGNMGFYVCFLEVFFFVCLICLIALFRYNMIRRYTNEILYNDCFFLDERDFKEIQFWTNRRNMIVLKKKRLREKAVIYHQYLIEEKRKAKLIAQNKKRQEEEIKQKDLLKKEITTIELKKFNTNKQQSPKLNNDILDNSHAQLKNEVTNIDFSNSNCKNDDMFNINNLKDESRVHNENIVKLQRLVDTPYNEIANSKLMLSATNIDNAIIDPNNNNVKINAKNNRLEIFNQQSDDSIVIKNNADFTDNIIEISFCNKNNTLPKLKKNKIKKNNDNKKTITKNLNEARVNVITNHAKTMRRLKNQRKREELEDLKKKEKIALEKCEKLKTLYQYEPTKRDIFLGLTMDQRLSLDHRTNCRYWLDHMMDSWIIGGLLFKRTLRTPFYISIVTLFNSIILALALNAFFFDENQMTVRNDAKVEESEKQVLILLIIILIE